VVVVAGKGHEDYQESNGVRRAFSDAACVADVLARRRAG
jgi:UDP-N-acetylmuramoyl-L-alanyl-D-glutamate--2,6-diaminopimelate ligase